MKKLFAVLLFCAGFLMPKVSEAQSSYYYHTGDTIVGRSPIYFYQWWSEQWLADTSHRLVHGHINWRHPSDWPYEWARYTTGLFVPHGEMLQYCYTDTPLEIIGIATAAIVTGIYGNNDLPGYTPEIQEYLRLYEASEDTFMLLKEVPFDHTLEKRYLEINTRHPYNLMSDSVCCYHHPIDRTNYIGIREHYFDKPVTVMDSFYVGLTTECHYFNLPPTEENPHIPNIGVTGYSVFWDSTYYASFYFFNCSNFCESTPSALHKYRHIAWDWNTGDTVDGSWHWWNSPYFMLEFPIVVIDSSYIIPPYECPPVQNVRLAQQGDGEAYVMWDTHGDHNLWQVSYGPANMDPDSGTVVNCPIQVGRIQGLDSCTHYWAYVRAVCNHDSICYSRWSDPVDIYFCDTTGGGSGGGDPEGILTALDAMTYIIPNPASSDVTVYSSFNISRIEAHSLQGVKTMDIPASGISASFDVKDWPSGVYVITIHTQGGNVTKKLVVQ